MLNFLSQAHKYNICCLESVKKLHQYLRSKVYYITILEQAKQLYLEEGILTK
jgi:hypothetical protein